MGIFKFKNIEISKIEKRYVLSIDNLTEKLDNVIIESIFWYPIFENKYENFLDELNNNNFTDFPTLLLIKSIVFNGTSYWVNKALDWYLEIDEYDIILNRKLEEHLLKSKKEQLFIQKIKRIISIKNRKIVDYKYIESHYSYTSFINDLKGLGINYRVVKKENSMDIIVHSKKYIFGSGTG